MATLPVCTPRTHAHVVLSTPELATIICYELRDLLLHPMPNTLGRSPMPSLRSLALSCSWLLPFALEALWCDLPDIAILLRTLPSTCWKGDLDPGLFWTEMVRVASPVLPDLWPLA